MRFHTLISEFRDKLESSQDQAKMTPTDIDAFYTKLNNFDVRFVLFSKYYRKYIANLNRFKPEPEEKNPDFTLLRVAIAENKWKPTTLFSIFIHHIKYENKITSKPFIAYQKRQNRKKLNAPVAKVKEVEKTNKSGNWTRVPISKHHPQKQDNCCQENKSN
ncbi:MAG: hypothetical protein ABI263_00775 [Gelidibacter sp.]